MARPRGDARRGRRRIVRRPPLPTGHTPRGAAALHPCRALARPRSAARAHSSIAPFTNGPTLTGATQPAQRRRRRHRCQPPPFGTHGLAPHWSGGAAAAFDGATARRCHRRSWTGPAARHCHASGQRLRRLNCRAAGDGNGDAAGRSPSAAVGGRRAAATPVGGGPYGLWSVLSGRWRAPCQPHNIHALTLLRKRSGVRGRRRGGEHPLRRGGGCSPPPPPARRWSTAAPSPLGTLGSAADTQRSTPPRSRHHPCPPRSAVCQPPHAAPSGREHVDMARRRRSARAFGRRGAPRTQGTPPTRGTGAERRVCRPDGPSGQATTIRGRAAGAHRPSRRRPSRQPAGRAARWRPRRCRPPPPRPSGRAGSDWPQAVASQRS